MVKLPHWPIPYFSLPANLSLERMNELMKCMGNPHRLLPPTIHVAGTNGKGSTIAFLKSILQSAGYKVHTYTSPHIIRYNERICLAGQEIDDDSLFRSIEYARLAADGMALTFFEGTTAAAFHAFANHEADVLLLETGMGGEFDATNIITNPIATIITSIDYDHMEYLGPNLKDIARAKSGIMKQGSPCIISLQYQEPLEALLESAISKRIGVFTGGVDWNVRELSESFLFIDDQGETEFPMPSLLGHHQVVNAGAAIACLQCLEGFKIRYRDIIQGITEAKWMGRLHKISPPISLKLPLSWEIWIDGAHNVGGAAALANNLDLWKGKKVVLINGRTKDRDIEGFLAPFLGKVQSISCVNVMSEPKSEDPEKISKIAHDLGFKDVLCFDNISDAIMYYVNCAKEGGDITLKESVVILIAGSLYLFADIMKA